MGHYPDLAGAKQSQSPPPSTLTKGPFGQPRPEALSPAAVLGLGWGKACACGRECQTTVWKWADMLVCFILSGQAQPWDQWKNQAGAGAEGRLFLGLLVDLRADHLPQV